MGLETKVACLAWNYNPKHTSQFSLIVVHMADGSKVPLWHKVQETSAYRLLSAYVQWRMPHVPQPVDQLSRRILVDEAILALYLDGLLPRLVVNNWRVERAYLNSYGDLKLLGIESAKLKDSQREQRVDPFFTKLVWRTEVRHAREQGLTWTEVVDGVFQFPQLKERYNPVQSFTGFARSGYKLERYFSGDVRAASLLQPIA